MAATNEVTLDSCIDLIRDIPDFPRKGIIFKDITPLLASGPHFTFVVDRMAELLLAKHVPSARLVCPEARGFIFGSALAYRLGAGFVPIRKPKKLPFTTTQVSYELEYGSDTVEMHTDAIEPGEEVVLVDDLLATGGTMGACAELLESVGARIRACVFLLELTHLEGRKRLGSHYPVHTLISL